MKNSPDPIHAISRLFSDTARFLRGNGCKAGCFVGNIALEMSDVNERFRERAGRFFEEWTKSIEKTLRRRRADGFFMPGLKPRAAAEAILALYEGAILLARARRDPDVFMRVGKEACGLLGSHRAKKSVGKRPVEV